MHRDRYLLVGSGLMAVIIGSSAYVYLPERFLSHNSTVHEPSVGTPSASGAQARGSQAVMFRVLDTGARASDASARKNYAAYSQEGYLKLWEMAHGTDGFVPPGIDFSKEYVIGVFAGEKPTGGHAISITAVRDEGDKRTISVTLVEPGKTCVVTQALTAPYQIIAVPRSPAVLAHADTSVSEPCK